MHFGVTTLLGAGACHRVAWRTRRPARRRRSTPARSVAGSGGVVRDCTLHITQRFTIEEMAPYIEKYQECVAELKAINTSLRNQLIEAGLQPVVGHASLEPPDSSTALSFKNDDDAGCAPTELLTGPTA